MRRQASNWWQAIIWTNDGLDLWHIYVSPSLSDSSWGGWGCGVPCGGHHQQRGKTTMGSALDGAVLDFTQILAYLVHNMNRSQLYLGFGHFRWLPFFSVSNILAGLWLNCISSVEIIHLFLFLIPFFFKLIVACRLCVIYVREDNDSDA